MGAVLVRGWFGKTINSMYICTRYDRGVEKLVSRRAHNPKAAGSSPAPATKEDLAPKVIGAFFIWSCSIMDIMGVSGTQDSGSIPDRTTIQQNIRFRNRTPP